MRRSSWIFVALALVPLSAAAMNPLDLIGRRPKPFVEPDGFYRVVLPAGFDCVAKPRQVTCEGKRGVKAQLSIHVNDVPRSATPDLVSLNQMERFKKKPHFQMIKKERLEVNGVPAVASTFRYDFMGNVQYKVGVKAMYLVQENKLYVLHFESRLDAFSAYQKDLETFYGSFKPTRLDPGGNPILSDLEVKEDRKQYDAIVPDPFKNSTPIGY